MNGKIIPDFETHELITPREALKILSWVTPSGLYSGAYRTNELTRFPGNLPGAKRKITLYSRQECEALKASIIDHGKPDRIYFPVRKAEQRPPQELV